AASSPEQLVPDELQLTRDVVGDVTVLESVGEYVPGVGLDLEVIRQRHLSVKPQRLLDRVSRRAERADLLQKNRHVEVGAQLCGSRVCFEGVEGLAEVQELLRTLGASQGALAEVDRVGEPSQLRH